MAFVGLDPIKMRDLASRSDSVSTDVSRLAERATSIISAHQLDDIVGDLGSLLDEAQTQMRDLASLATTKAADMERAAGGGHRSLIGDPDDGIAKRKGSKRGERKSALENVRGNINHADDLPMSSFELRGVRDRLDKLSEADRAWVLGQLTDEELERLFYNARNDSGWWPWSWGDEERDDLYELLDCLPDDERVRFALAEAKSQAIDSMGLQAAMDTLAQSDEFTDLDRDQQIAILAQAANYPHTDSILNLQRLAGKPWAANSRLEDFQRSAKLIANLSQYKDGDTVIQYYTLESFLADDATYVIRWDSTIDEGTFGQALEDTLSLNPDYLDAGNGSVEQSVPDGVSTDETLHLVRNTTAHEVNHLRNGGAPVATYSRFMSEYRASYVGFQAEHGRPPTRKEMVERVKWMLDPTSAYSTIRSALADSTEAEKIAGFVSELLGEEVNPQELRDRLDDGARDDDLPAAEPVSASGGPNSIDNSPWS